MTVPPPLRVSVRVTPRARRTKLTLDGDILKIAITAPPVDGKANAALIKLLAKVLGIKRSAIVIRSGERGRDKVIELAGITRAELARRLP